jgi:hypothetical protein
MGKKKKKELENIFLMWKFKNYEKKAIMTYV